MLCTVLSKLLTTAEEDLDRSVAMAAIDALTEMLKDVGVCLLSSTGSADAILRTMKAVFSHKVCPPIRSVDWVSRLPPPRGRSLTCVQCVSEGGAVSCAVSFWHMQQMIGHVSFCRPDLMCFGFFHSFFRTITTRCPYDYEYVQSFSFQ